MSRAYATPLELELIPSRRQYKLLLLIYALVTISILLLPWHFLSRLAFLAGVLLSGQFLLHRKPACNRIVWQSGNNWLLTMENVTSKAVLLPETLTSFWLVILLFRLENGKRYPVMIWPDSIHADVFRRLRVRLKIEGNAVVGKVSG